MDDEEATEAEIEEALEPLVRRIIPGYSKEIGCYNAWVPDLVELDRRLAEIDPGYAIAQVKVKFGGLRFYFDTNSERRTEMHALVEEVETRLSEPPNS